MPTPIEGLDASNLRIAIAASRWNAFITDKLVSGAVKRLREVGANDANIRVVRVPGAWEIPIAADRLAASGEFDAVIGIGCLIRGDTPHFDYIAYEVSRGLGQIGLTYGLPVTFGVITVENLDQAIARSVEGPGNKGAEAAEAAVEMVHILNDLPPRAK
jgi:6,7-dimethyl-8-ribityllumazine synthase